MPPEQSSTNLTIPVQVTTIETDAVTRQFLLSRLLIKAADLSHIQQPFNQAGRWDDRIHEEFFDQGSKEKALGFTPDALYDREEANTLQRAPVSICLVGTNKLETVL